MDPNPHDDPFATPTRRAFSWSWLANLNPAGRIEPSDPGKELRFTRSAQAVHFTAAAILCACAVFALLTLGLWPWHPDGSPFLSIWWPGLLPVVPMFAFLWLAVFCASHAYIILSPVGVEIFPFRNPVENFRLVAWQQIRHFRVEGRDLILEFGDAPGQGGVVLSLRPLRRDQQELLVHAIDQRISPR